jgi:hypothetical protein
MNSISTRQRLAALLFSVLALAIIAGSYWHPVVQAQGGLTPGMLFGPVSVGDGQHAELCSGNLGEGDLSAFVHFRNITTGEVTPPVEVALKQGGGGCAIYSGAGRVIGMTRTDGRGSDWVSPSNPLIATMAVVDNDGSARVAVLGIAKLWLRGL